MGFSESGNIKPNRNKDSKEPEYPSLYDPRSKTGRYHPNDEEYKKKMATWQKWYSNSKNQ